MAHKKFKKRDRKSALEARREMVLTLADLGLNPYEIARRLKKTKDPVGESGVRYILKTYQHDKVKAAPKSGRPSKITHR